MAKKGKKGGGKSDEAAASGSEDATSSEVAEAEDVEETDVDGDEDSEDDGVDDDDDASEDDDDDDDDDDVSEDDELAAAKQAAEEALAALEAAKKKGKKKSASDDATSKPKKKKKKSKKADPKPVVVASGDDDEEDVDQFFHIKPHSDGLFDPSVIDEKAGRDFTPDKPFEPGRHRLGGALLAAAAAVIIAGFAIILTNEQYSEDLQAFLEGDVEAHKTAEKRLREAQWRDEDRKARNRYGSMTITYFPADGAMGLKKVTFEAPTLDDPPMKVGEEDLPNDTQTLRPGQLVDRVIIENLPVFEAEKGPDGAVKRVLTYQYIFSFTREGYFDKEIKYTVDDWQRLGPGNLQIPWNGLDLVPKPETQKANLQKAVTEMHCALKKDNVAGLTLEDLNQTAEADREIIRLRNAFKTEEDFVTTYMTLTTGEHSEWWEEAKKEIAKDPCE